MELLLPPPNELLKPPFISKMGGTGRTSSVRIFFGRPRFFFGGCPLTNSPPFMPGTDELDEACAETFDCSCFTGITPSVRIFLGRPRFFFTGTCPTPIPFSNGGITGRICCCGCAPSSPGNSLTPTRAGKSSDDRESTAGPKIREHVKTTDRIK